MPRSVIVSSEASASIAMVSESAASSALARPFRQRHWCSLSLTCSSGAEQHLAEYDCVIFGTSRSSLLPEEKIEGYRCYNLSVSDGTAPEYLRYAKYLWVAGTCPA